MSIKDKFDDFVWDVKYGTPKEKAKAGLKAAAVVLDAATVVTGTGAAVKTVKTASKLAKCGKGAKMVATFTGHAQKTNLTKAAKKVAAYQTAKAAAKKMSK